MREPRASARRPSPRGQMLIGVLALGALLGLGIIFGLQSHQSASRQVASQRRTEDVSNLLEQRMGVITDKISNGNDAVAGFLKSFAINPPATGGTQPAVYFDGLINLDPTTGATPVSENLQYNDVPVTVNYSMKMYRLAYNGGDSTALDCSGAAVGFTVAVGSFERFEIDPATNTTCHLSDVALLVVKAVASSSDATKPVRGTYEVFLSVP